MIYLNSLSKVLKCAANEDKITIKADDDPDSIAFCFESPSKLLFIINKKGISIFDSSEIDLNINNNYYRARSCF